MRGHVCVCVCVSMSMSATSCLPRWKTRRKSLTSVVNLHTEPVSTVTETHLTSVPSTQHWGIPPTTCQCVCVCVFYSWIGVFSFTLTHFFVDVKPVWPSFMYRIVLLSIKQTKALQQLCSWINTPTHTGVVFCQHLTKTLNILQPPVLTLTILTLTLTKSLTCLTQGMWKMFP